MIIAVFIFMEETGIGILLCIYYFLFYFPLHHTGVNPW